MRKNTYVRVLIIGPQGSGKSTQAKLLSKYLNLPVISTGDIFRKQASVSEIIRTTLQEGKLVDDVTTSKIVQERLNEKDCQNGFIMDGYPRTVEQMRIFDPNFDKVFYLDVFEDEVIKRLTERGRADDTDELIRRRLDLYYKQTQPLLDYYKKMGILINIDGRGTIEKIQQELRTYFK